MVILNTLFDVINVVLDFVKILVIASIVVSWVGDRNNQIVQMITSITEPIYRPFRKITSKLPGPLDWSPILIFLAIFVIQALIRNIQMTYQPTIGFQ